MREAFASPTKGAEEPWILGLSYSHNGAACLLRGAELVVAIQEERLTRHKRQRTRPEGAMLSISYCLRHAGIGLEDLDAIAVSILQSPQSAMDSLRRNPQMAAIGEHVPVYPFSHHITHAAYVAAVSGAERAAVLIADGMGSSYEALKEDERAVVASATAPAPVKGTRVGLSEMVSLYDFEQGRLTPVFKQMTPRLAPHEGHQGKYQLPGAANRHGLGAMYERASEAIFGGEQQAGKVMGLAPFGRPNLPVEAFHRVRDDGALEFSNPDILRLDYSQAHRTPMDPAGVEAQGLAASVQQALEHGMLHFARHAHHLTDASTLLLGGGVALNGVANERIIREGPFQKVHIPPAVEDSGNAIGAAYLALWQCQPWRRTREQRVDATGRPYSPSEIDAAIAATPFVQAESLGDRMVQVVADRLASGDVLGWFQGGSELGPRALGQRSILCDPRPSDAKARLNAKVKHREAFRPFAPMVLADHAADWFDLPPGVDRDGPFMTRVVPIRPEKQSLIPAVTHVDGTGRFQTISPDCGPIFDLLTAFHERTGVPILLNTSFNLAGEPIIETPSDALFDLLATDIDGLVLRDRFVRRLPDRAPGFGDLVPELIGDFLTDADRVQAREHGVKFNSLGNDSFDDIGYRIRTPYGDAYTFLDQTTLPLISRIDGRASVTDITESLHLFLRDPSKTPHVLQKVLATLVRKKLVRLRCPKSNAVIGLNLPAIASPAESRACQH